MKNNEENKIELNPEEMEQVNGAGLYHVFKNVGKTIEIIVKNWFD